MPLRIAIPLFLLVFALGACSEGAGAGTPIDVDATGGPALPDAIAAGDATSLPDPAQDDASMADAGADFAEADATATGGESDTWIDDTTEPSPDVEIDPDEDVVAPPESPEMDDPTEPMLVKQTRFGVFHWNIAGGKENNCQTGPIKRAVMEFVRESPEPIDFVSLNEVCPAQYDAIRDALRNYWGKGPNETFSAYQNSNGGRAGNAFFSRRNVDQVTRLKIGHDQYGDRFLLCGRQVGRRMRVCSTHLTPADGTARQQLPKVIDKLESWWTDRRDTVVIAGDFNIMPNDPGMNQMYAASANTPNNPNNSGHYREWDDDDAEHCRGFGQRSTRNTSNGPCGTGTKIDFIFARQNRIVNGDYQARTLNIPDDCTGVCSDHRPVRGVATLKFRVD